MNTPILDTAETAILCTARSGILDGKASTSVTICLPREADRRILVSCSVMACEASVMQQLEAHEKPLAKIFCGDYDFRVPNYQRPYAWGTDQAAELLDDLTGALERNEGEPYFLGSLVLIKQPGAPRSEIIDGQQRLTTLTILFSVLAELAGADTEGQFRDLILEPGSVLLGLPAKPRLELRPKDAAFFRKYVQTAGQLGQLLALSASEPTNDAQAAIQANARHFHKKLSEWPPERCLELGKLLAQRTYLVVVSTPDLASAHRIFSVMNARGLDLSPADVFKSDVIGAIPEDLREVYARKWEDAEEDLGRSDFADLFLHIRMIFDKRRARSELLKEFPEQVTSPSSARTRWRASSMTSWSRSRGRTARSVTRTSRRRSLGATRLTRGSGASCNSTTTTGGPPRSGLCGTTVAIRNSSADF